MNIDWNEAPKWARFAAMDDLGNWFWYENEPLRKSYYWESYGGRFKFILTEQPKWQESLTERPE